MLNWLIDVSLRHRFAVIALVIAVSIVGALSLLYLDIDAFPDGRNPGVTESPRKLGSFILLTSSIQVPL